MVKDFNINDLTDQLVQNPLNLPYSVAEKHYNKWIKDRQTHLIQNGFTYDPSPKPKGVGYNFEHGGHIRQRFYNTFQKSSDEILWIIAWHQNPNNYLTNNNKTNYENHLKTKNHEIVDNLYAKNNREVSNLKKGYEKILEFLTLAKF